MHRPSTPILSSRTPSFSLQLLECSVSKSPLPPVSRSLFFLSLLVADVLHTFPLWVSPLLNYLVSSRKLSHNSEIVTIRRLFSFSILQVLWSFPLYFLSSFENLPFSDLRIIIFLLRKFFFLQQRITPSSIHGSLPTSTRFISH